MERKASFSVEKPKRRSSEHNSRIDKPKYLLENDPDFDGNFYGRYNGYKNDDQMSLFLEEFYQEKFNQKMQNIQKPALIKEVVISLKKEHTEKDIISLFDELKKKYGGHEIFEISIHRDEGFFLGKDGLSYYPNTDIFYDKEDKKWYLDRELKKPSPDNLEKIYNYHAHVKFTMMNLKTAKTPQMPKAKYSTRHKVVAEFLGLRCEPGRTRFNKKSVNQIKEEYHDNREKQKATITALQEQLADKLANKGKVSLKDLAELKEEFRKEMIASELFYTKEDYQDLNALFVEAKELNKSKDLDLFKLREQVKNISDGKMKQKALKAKIAEQEVVIKEKDALIVTGNDRLAEIIERVEVLKLAAKKEHKITMADIMGYKLKLKLKDKITTTTVGEQIKKQKEENKELKKSIKLKDEKIGKLEATITDLRTTISSLKDTIKGFISSKLSAMLAPKIEKKKEKSKGIEFIDNRENDSINDIMRFKRF